MNKGLGKKEKRGLCKVCGKYSDTHCSGCGCIFYCSVEHQRNDWQRHKKECKEFRKARDGAKADAKKSKNAVRKDRDADSPEGTVSSKAKQKLLPFRCSQCLYGPPHTFDHALAQGKLAGFTCKAGMVCDECWDAPSLSSRDPLTFVGRAVELYGLRAQQWNGRKGIVLMKLETVPARYAVQVGDASQPIKIKPENLRRLEKEQETFPAAPNAGHSGTERNKQEKRQAKKKKKAKKKSKR